MVEIQGFQAFCKEVPEICHADVSRLLIYLIFGTILTVKCVKLGDFRHFFENSRYEEWSEVWHADVSWSSSKLFKFWWLLIFLILAQFLNVSCVYN